MTPLRSPALVLTLLAPLSAQTPNPGVDDLLRRGTRFDAARSGVVTGLPRPGAETLARVHGEIHLLPSLRKRYDFSFSRHEEMPGPLTEDALRAILGTLREGLRDEIDFHDLGTTTLLDTEYPEQAAGPLELVRRALPQPVRCRVRLTRETEQGSEVLLESEVAFVDGRMRVLADSSVRPKLYDYDVEIAQSAASASPIVVPVSSGASIAARVRPLPLGEDAIVEAVVRVADPSGSDTWTPHSAIGPIDRLRSRIDEAGIAFRIRRGAEAVHEWRTLEGATLRLSWSADWEPAEPHVEGHTMLASALFGAPVLGFRNDVSPSREEPADATWIERLVGRMVESSPPDVVLYVERNAGRGGALVLGVEGERFARNLTERIDHLLTPLRVTVEAFDCAQGSTWTDGAPPADARPLLRVTGPVLVNLPVTFASAREQSYIHHWNVEVASGTRISDPQIRVCEEGWSITVRPVRSRGQAVDRCELVLRIGRLIEMRALEVRLAAAMMALAPVTDDARPPAVWLPEDLVQVEMPELATVRLRNVVALTDGHAVVRHSAAGLYGKGREIVVRLGVE